MALFFDQDWFDKRLAHVGKSEADIADALELHVANVREIWKDQRELMPHEVTALADLLQASVAEIADHAGVSTPVPREGPPASVEALLPKLDEMNTRLMRVERALLELKALVLDLRS
ncbi:MAG: hypothetical protein RLN89_09995 [Parvibaculum sp.]